MFWSQHPRIVMTTLSLTNFMVLLSHGVGIYFQDVIYF